MSNRRSQSQKSSLKKEDSSLNNSELYSIDQFNQEDGKKKQQSQVITVSSLAQKLLNYNEKNSFDKYFSSNIVRISEKLIQKRSFPKFIIENSLAFLKMLNRSASQFMEIQEYDSTMQVLDLALRLSSVIRNELQADVQQFVTMNNLAILSNKIGKATLSKRYLKVVLEKIQKNYSEDKPDAIEIVEAITLNNLCSIYLHEQKYEKVYQHSENALILVENKLFKRIKEEGETSLKRDKQFINDLQILLQGYIYRGWSQDEIKNQIFQEYIQRNEQGEDLFSDKQKIYNNGYRLSTIILGKDSKMSKIFQQLLKQAKQEQQEIQRKLQKSKDTDFEEMGGVFKYYQNRIECLQEMCGQDYMDSSIEDRLYILKQSYKKSENPSFSEQNNITIIDTQEDQNDYQDLQFQQTQKTEYIKGNVSVSQPQSPKINKASRNDNKQTFNKKIIFRNQSPNLKLNQNYNKGKRTNNINILGNPNLISGMKERAQSFHSGVNSYFLNQTGNNMIRGVSDHYGANESNFIGMNQTNVSQLYPQQYNNGYMYEGGVENQPINNADQQVQGLSRHQQLQHQLYLQQNQQNGNGMFYQNKNRFNNTLSNIQNPNFFNNTIDYQNNNILQQQNEYIQSQMGNLNQFQPLQQQLSHQTSIGTPLQNPNQFGPSNRFTSFIKSLSQPNTQPPLIPQIQPGMTPNQILQAQLQTLSNLKYPMIGQNGGTNVTNSGQIQFNGANQMNSNLVQQNLQGQINTVNTNANNNDSQQQYQQYVQDENNKISSNKVNFQEQKRNVIQSGINPQIKQDFESFSSKTNKPFEQQNQIQNKNVDNYSNKVSGSNHRIEGVIPKVVSQYETNTDQLNYSQQQKLQAQMTQEGNETTQSNNFFVLNKDYHIPESAAFPSIYSPDAVHVNRQINSNENNELSQKQIPNKPQSYYTKQTGTFYQDNRLSNSTNGNNETNNTLARHEKLEEKNGMGQFNIPLHLIDTKTAQSQNGEATKNTKTTNPSSQQTPQTNVSKNDKIQNANGNLASQIKATNDQKRLKYQEQYTKEIVSLKNIPNIIGSSNGESQIAEKQNGQVPSQQYSQNIAQAINMQKEEEGQKDQRKEKEPILPNVTNVKLSESTAYNPVSPKNNNYNGQKDNIVFQFNNNNLNSPQVTPIEALSNSKGINPVMLQSPTHFINNQIMLQNQQFQSTQNVKLPNNIKKIKDEEQHTNKLIQSPQSQSSSNYSYLNKFQINTNVNGMQGGGSIGSGNLNSAGNGFTLNGQQFFISQNNQSNNKISLTSNQNIGSQSRTQSKQRLPSINAMVQNSNNSQNAIQNYMQLSDISMNKNIKLSDQDIYTPIGSSKHYQWGIFNDTETDLLRHINAEYLSTVNCTVSKVLQFNSIQYLVEVGINKNSVELTFEISGYQIQDKIPLQTESLTLTLLKGILGMLDLNDGTPFNKPFKTVHGFKDLCQYLIFPFIKINQHERKIEINYILHSLLQYQVWTIEFLKINCQITINHLNNNEFKLSLKAKDKEAVRIDICFDEATMKTQFQKLEFPENKNFERVENYEREEVKNITDLVEWFDEEEVNVNKKEKIQELNQKMVDMKKFQKIQLPNYQIPNTIIFLEKMNILLNTVQQYLMKHHNYSSFQQYVEDSSFKVLRIHVNDDFKKGQIFFVRESATQPKTVCVSLQNIHESHAPDGKMIQCVGKKDVDTQDFWKIFGIQYENLDKEEKYLFLTLIGLKYNLYVHTKPLEPDDYGRYQDNPIIQNNMSIGGFSRTFKGNSYKYPLTCQLMGFDDIPYGVKVTLHDQEQNSDYGVFYIIDSISWLKFKREEDPNAKKKRTKKYKDEFDIIKNYELANILYTLGYKLLENSICFREFQPNQLHIAGRNLYSRFISNVDRLENVVNTDEIINLLISTFSS